MLLDRITHFFRIYGYHHILTWMIHVLAIFALIYLDIIYFLFGIVVFLLIMPLLQLIFHEYVSHEIIKPRNKIIDFLVLFLFYTHGQTVKNKRAFHVTHHVGYLDPTNDPTQLKIKAAKNIFWYIFNLQQPLAQELIPVKNTLLESNDMIKLLEPHAFKIAWFYRLVMFLLLPIEWFCVFVLYLLWLNILISAVHDVFFHSDINGQDSSWLLPLWSNAAWHIKHHENPDSLYFGPTWLKWLNLSWYYYLCLFKPRRDVDFSQ